MLSLPLAALILCLTALPLFLAVVYRMVGRPLIALHFSEDPSCRRRSPEKLRRRAFEHHCGRALSCFYSLGVLGSLRNVVEQLAPDAGAMIVWFQVLLLIGAFLFIWAALSRWTRPFED